MVKITVYLPESDAAALRRLALETGRSQAELIREAIAATTARARGHRFRSHGAGEGDGRPVGRRSREIYLKGLSRRAR